MNKKFFKKFLTKINLIVKKKGKKNNNIKEVLEDLIVDKKNVDQNIDDGTKKIFKNVINLNNKCLEDIMIPRANVDAVAEHISLNDLISYIDKTKHSRIPIYRENLDKIVGMIHIRDLFKKMNKKEKITTKGKITKRLIRKILFSSPSMKILDLLLKMRSEQIHMSIVVDEFGGTNGLVTIEDLVEEIVGEIKDEHDLEQVNEIKKVSKNTYEVSARVVIEEFEKIIGKFLKDQERGEVDTLGGLVYFLAGRIPERGEIIYHSSGIEFNILDADTRRINRMNVVVR